MGVLNWRRKVAEWTEQPDGTWRRGPLAVCPSHGGGWFWYKVLPPYSAWSSDSETAKAAADAWAADMLAQLKQLNTPSNPGENLAHEPGRV